MIIFLLESLVSKNNAVGSVMNNYSDIKSARRYREYDLRRREVEALEKIASKSDKEAQS